MKTLQNLLILMISFFKHSIQKYLGRGRITGVHNWNVASRGIDTHQASGLSYDTKI
jgi:hypothetical protein